MCLCRRLVSICVWFPFSVRALHQGAAGATAGPGTQGAGEDPASHSRPIWSGGPSQNRGGYQVKHALTCPQRSHQAGLASQTLDKQVWRPRSANHTWAPPLIARPIRLWFYADAVFVSPCCLLLVIDWGSIFPQKDPVNECDMNCEVTKPYHNTNQFLFLLVCPIDSTTLRKTWILLWRRRLRALVRWSCCTSTAK